MNTYTTTHTHPHIHRHIHTYIHQHSHSCSHTYTHACIHKDINANTDTIEPNAYIHTYIALTIPPNTIHKRTHTCMHTYIHNLSWLCVNVSTCIHTYILIHDSECDMLAGIPMYVQHWLFRRFRFLLPMPRKQLLQGT
jgi:hypothetical protein